MINKEEGGGRREDMIVVAKKMNGTVHVQKDQRKENEI